MKKKLQKLYLTYYNLLTAQDLIASSILNQFSEEIHKIKCKFGLDDKKCENCEIKYNNYDCFVE